MPCDSIISEWTSSWVSVKEKKELRNSLGYDMFSKEVPEGLVVVDDLNPHLQGLI